MDEDDDDNIIYQFVGPGSSWLCVEGPTREECREEGIEVTKLRAGDVPTHPGFTLIWATLFPSLDWATYFNSNTE